MKNFLKKSEENNMNYSKKNLNNMTQEQKQLLLQDLCARLPYKVFVSPMDCGKAILIGFKNGYPLLFDTIHSKEYEKPWELEYIKPYLRPMSSMTEEEDKEYTNIDNGSYTCPKDIAHIPASYRIDWLNAHHFDYRNLIPMGLALSAPEGMYKKE